MKKAPLIFGILMITVLVAYLALFRSSPGDLSNAHASLAEISIITNCKKCHDPAGLTTGCLNCHEEIHSQLEKKKGYHAFLLVGKKLECASCHQEHKGKTFNLVNRVSWGGQDESTFKHPPSDFHLTGKHVTLKCDDCHAKKGMTPFTLKNFSQHPRTKTYLGLTQECRSCHADVHAKGLTPRCDQCHDQNTFRSSPFFNHDRYFPLQRGHAHLTCLQCHVLPTDTSPSSKKPGWPFSQVKGTRCADCHDNPHRTNWGTKCEACHTSDASPWATARGHMTKALHAKTGFLLTSPHQLVTCNSCHVAQGTFTEKYPNPSLPGYRRSQNSCEGCHRDPHAGQFLKTYPRCILCHNDKKFSPPKFGVKEHTSYPLKGSHLGVACVFCHTDFIAPKVRRYNGTPQICAACHEDIHRGQFSDKGVIRCDQCHLSWTSWVKINFNHNQQSRFKLDDAHSGVACRLCHPTVQTKKGKRMVLYKPLKSECKDCHALTQPER